MSDYDAAALAADLFGLFEAGGWTAVVAANEASPENEAKRLDLRAQRDALTTRIAAEFARLTAERDGWAAQSEANREWVDDLGRKLRDLEAERDAANERAGRLEGLLREAVKASALDGYEDLEASAMVELGEWEPDGEGGYRVVAAPGEEVR